MDRTAATRWTYAGLLAIGMLALTVGWFTFAGGGDAKPRTRYTEGVVGSPERVNPLLSLSDAEADLAALVFSGLTRPGPDGIAEPDLAASWEITPDARTYTFQLRSGVSWQDGARLDSSDIAFTVALVQSPGFDGAPELAARWAGIDVLIVDARTVIFRLPAPSASFLTAAALPILPEHLLRDVQPGALSRAAFNRAPVGTGPYRLIDFNRRVAQLEANTSYHLGAPAITTIEFRYYETESARLDALAAGEIDGALLAPGSAPLQRDRPASRLQTGGFLLLYLNNQRAPLNEPSLRRALAAAVDTGVTTAAAGNAGSPGSGPIVPGSWAYASPPQPPPSDVGALFDRAGWALGDDGLRQRDGQTLTLELATNADPLREALALAVAELLAPHGVEVNVSVESAPELLRRRVLGRDYELLLFGWEQGPDPDPYSGWHTSQIAPGGRNVAGYIDARSDALLEAARLTVDIADRRALYAEFLERFAENAPAIVLLYPQRAYVRPATLAGVTEGLIFEPSDRFRDVHAWRFEG